MSNSANPQIPWWKRGQRETLDDRVRAVQNVNDPTIISDDVQRWSKVALVGLLAFTTLLSGFSYFKFFEKSFGVELAAIMSLLLAFVIEFGKNWGFLKVLRIPFFQGWKFVWDEISNTVMWVFLLLLSIVTFAASVYNSTQGAHQLSLLLSHERTYSAFSPNTANIDAQIADLKTNDASLGDIRRKNGKTNWAIQPMKAENAKTLASLQEQRRASIEKQRSDWEKQASIQEGQNAFGANSLLAVGGWVELLQIILMFVRASAEKSLDKTAPQRRTTTPPPYQSHTQPSRNGFKENIINEGSRIGFFWKGYGETPIRAETHNDLDGKTPVSQSSQPVTQADSEETGSHADDVLKLALTRLQGHAANFDRKHGKNSTTAENIHEILDETLRKMKGTFRPSLAAHTRFCDYVDTTLFPLLREKGFRYPKEIQFDGWLRTVAPMPVG